jgi:dihydroflavonol-4-reductase
MARRDAVFLTGAGGFVGSHVLNALVSAGYPVRALVRSTSRTLPAIEGCAPVLGDLREPASLIPALRGCRYLIHVAALYSFAPAKRREIWATNVRGCAGLLEAAAMAGVERAVVTSSSATVGHARGRKPATEDDYAWDAESSPYHNSKCAQERVALAARIPVVLVLPTAPVGPGDWKPTPTGKMIVDFMRGRMFGSLGGGMNVVAVEDVAAAHVSALERGQAGERYLIGGENLSLDQIWRILAGICRRKPPTARVPYGLALGLGWGEEIRLRLFRGRLGGEAPLVPLEGVRMARHNMFVSDEKARAMLGHRATSVRDALERAVTWYSDHGYAL